MKYNTFCPLFPGFYNTTFEYYNEEDDINNYNEEHGTKLSYDDFEWNYKDYEDRTGRAFVSKVESELKQFLPIGIEFQQISSPKEYNFTNDSIYISVNLSLDKLIKLIKDRKESAATYFKETYTSCSGFISFHSSNISDWLNKGYILENPDHRIGALLSCLCSIEIDADDIIYWAEGEGYMDFTPKSELITQ